MKKVTIQDIAMELGLSRNTVAKALNGGFVSPSTKQAVVQKAWQMGYAKLDENLLQEVKSVYHKNVVDEDDKNGEGVLKLIADDVKGIIFLSLFPIQFVKGVSKAGLPMTFFNSPVNAQEYINLGDVVSVDGFYAMNRMTSYIIKNKGCTKLAYIGYAEGSRMIQARYLGYLNACNQNYIGVDEKMQFTHPANHINFSYAMVEEAMNQMMYVPDAIICEDDDVAKNVALALLQKDPLAARKTVITGFNNTIEPDFFKRDILTVEVRMEELGKRLVKSVMDRVKDPTMDVSFTTIATYPKIEENYTNDR